MNGAIVESAVDVGMSSPRPGRLLAPFRWAASRVMQLALVEPSFLVHLAELDTLRLHVISFYLALRPSECASRESAMFLALSASREIIAGAVGISAGPIIGLLRRLPEHAVEADVYVSLVTIASNAPLSDALLKAIKADERVAHTRAIPVLADMPPALTHGRLLRVLDYDIRKLLVVADAADWFRRRWNTDATERFATVRNLAELRRLVIELLYGLPPMVRLPPRTVGLAKIIETPADLRRAGREGQNCLGHSVHNFSNNDSAYYVWDDGGEPIYIQVARALGLCWSLRDMKVAKNQEPSDDRRQLVESAFEVAGIESRSMGNTLAVLLMVIYGEEPW